MITTEVTFEDNKISIGVFRAYIRNSGINLYIGAEMVQGTEWHAGYLFGTLEHAVNYSLLHQAPDESTHYKKTKKDNYRYYKQDAEGNWLQYVDKRYPLGWQPIGKFDDLTEIKPLL
ncbi:hypothetical protein [uncultured Acinetobacter sp.]|uniref:hypothetical protein n=1 Tax=Acinetobacter soli TaxID=487316 RepID=UPI002585F40A|nr:hypothetical protein [uncultured Acinetobacter sp.]WOQ37368.1 hypothetical protein R3L12_02015 [Acinetobacter soli]